MCKFIGKSNERILCKLRKSEILRLYSIVHVAMETGKSSVFTRQSKSFIITLSLAKFQLVSSNLFLAMVWQMTYNHKLPKLCLATLKSESWNDSKTVSSELKTTLRPCTEKGEAYHLILIMLRGKIAWSKKKMGCVWSFLLLEEFKIYLS